MKQLSDLKRNGRIEQKHFPAKPSPDFRRESLAGKYYEPNANTAMIRAPNLTSKSGLREILITEKTRKNG
jgi:hypothetical protein